MGILRLTLGQEFTSEFLGLLSQLLDAPLHFIEIIIFVSLGALPIFGWASGRRLTAESDLFNDFHFLINFFPSFKPLVLSFDELSPDI